MNVGKKPTAKNYRAVTLLFVVSKFSEKIVNDRLVDHLGKCGLLSDFQYCAFCLISGIVAGLLDQLQIL